MKDPREENAWVLLSALNPDDVCRTASVSYDTSSTYYCIKSFGWDITLSVRDRRIAGNSPGSDALLERSEPFFRLAFLWYLVTAKDIACTRRMVNLEHIRGGDIFSRGSHVLPLEKVAARFGKDREGFIERGKILGGEVIQQGDAAIRLYPLPRVPFIMTLWLEDEEFPARVTIAVDSTCELQLPVDVIWSVAMETVLIMVR